MLCSLDLNVLRAQRIIGFLTTCSFPVSFQTPQSENPRACGNSWYALRKRIYARRAGFALRRILFYVVRLLFICHFCVSVRLLSGNLIDLKVSEQSKVRASSAFGTRTFMATYNSIPTRRCGDGVFVNYQKLVSFIFVVNPSGWQVFH